MKSVTISLSESNTLLEFLLLYNKEWYILFTLFTKILIKSFHGSINHEEYISFPAHCHHWQILCVSDPKI